MKKIVSILAILITVPALATDITNSSDCDNTTLGTYSAPVDMEAKWTANTINLQWYDDANDSTPTNTTCQYSSTIALPSQPTKPGYNFAGWQLRQATTFDLSTLAEYINSGGNAWISRSVPTNEYNNGNPMCRNGYSEDGTCSDAIFSDLDNGEWKVPFDYGTVRGVALCSSTNGTYATTGTPDETGTGTTQYCWCKASGFAEPNSSTYTNVASPSWVFNYDNGNADGCAYRCARDCAYYVIDYSAFRRAVYGITE